MIRESFSFEVQSGNSLKEYHDKNSVVWVEGDKGNEYTVMFRNNSNRRVAIIVTVDGKNVVDGQSGSYNGGGYIIEAYGYVSIPGWRLDNDKKKVDKFNFVDIAAKMGNDSNVGVIGCAVFYEKAKKEFNFAGDIDLIKTTGIGIQCYVDCSNPVTEQNFESNPVTIFAIRYGDKETLKKHGIDTEVISNEPNPFPGNTGYCKPPDGWKS